MPHRLLHATAGAACRSTSPFVRTTTLSLRLLSSSPRALSKAAELSASLSLNYPAVDDPPSAPRADEPSSEERPSRPFIPSELSHRLDKLGSLRPRHRPDPVANDLPPIGGSSELLPSSAFQTSGLEAAPNHALSHLGRLPPIDDFAQPTVEPTKAPLSEAELAQRAEKAARTARRKAEEEARKARPLSLTRILIRELPPDMWEEEIENLIRDRLDTSSTMTVAIVRGKRQLKLSRRGEHSGVATVNFANGGLSAAAEKLAARAIEELNGFAIAAGRPLNVELDHKTENELTRASVRATLKRKKRQAAANDQAKSASPEATKSVAAGRSSSEAKPRDLRPPPRQSSDSGVRSLFDEPVSPEEDLDDVRQAAQEVEQPSMLPPGRRPFHIGRKAQRST